MLREEVLVAVPRAGTAGGLSGIMSQLSDEDFQRIQVGRQEWYRIRKKSGKET